MIAWALVSSLLVVYVCSACDVMKYTCSTPDGKYGTCINGTCTVIQAEVRKDLRFKIVVKYPETTLKVRIDWRRMEKDLNLLRHSGLFCPY